MVPVSDVAGYCPMGCGHTLFVGSGGHITCSWAHCPNPSAVDELLADRAVVDEAREEQAAAKRGTFGRCRRCGHRYDWPRYPSSWSVMMLGRAIREHYEAEHPDVEVGR